MTTRVREALSDREISASVGPGCARVSAHGTAHTSRDAAVRTRPKRPLTRGSGAAQLLCTARVYRLGGAGAPEKVRAAISRSW
jgi:hypothetical protein